MGEKAAPFAEDRATRASDPLEAAQWRNIVGLLGERPV